MTNRRSGFTFIEVIIVLLVIVTLTALGTVAMSSFQKQAEDSERSQDIETITRALETYYQKGNPRVIDINTKGTYPGTNELVHIFGWDWCADVTLAPKLSPCNTTGEGENAEYYADVLPGLNRAAMTPPGLTEQVELKSTFGTAGPPDQVSGLITQGHYVYKPLTRGDGDMTTTATGSCTDLGTCGAYVIFYKKTDGTIVTVRSKHQ